MARPRRQFPAPPSDHKGQARVWWAGDYVHLGKFNSPEALAAYANLLRSVALNEPVGLVRPDDQLAAEVFAAHLKAAERRLGSKDLSVLQRVVATVTLLHGAKPLSQFGPRAVTQWLRLLAAGDESFGLTKPLRGSTLRRYLRVLKAALRWAITNEVTAADRFPWAEIQEVQAADVDAAPSVKVLPVAAEVVHATVPFMAPPVAAMVRLQLLTAMRPNDELFHLRPADVHRGGRVTLSTGLPIDLDKVNAGQERAVWVYVPRWHKQQSSGGGRDVPLGPQAQAVLAPFLDRDPESHCFSPREAMVHHRTKRLAPDSPLTRGRISTNLSRFRTYYTADSYRQAIGYACDRAGVEHWFPYRIRHTTATETTADAGLDVARALLGQSDPRTTLRYAERDFRAAAEQMRKAG